MAETTLDLTPGKIAERAATFRRGSHPEAEPEDQGAIKRRAAFRPNPDVARQQGVLDALLESLERDLNGVGDDRDAVARAAFAAALIDEALGRDHEAGRRLEELGRARPSELQAKMLAHRLQMRGEAPPRQAHATQAANYTTGLTAQILRLEDAYARWLRGEQPEWAALQESAGGDLAQLWRARLLADSKLADGHVSEAIDAFSAAIGSIRDASLAVRLRERVAVWAATHGDLERALALLRGCEPDQLRAPLRIFGASLGFDLGDDDAARGLLVPLVERMAVSPSVALSAATICERAGELDRARRIVARVVDENPEDWTALRALETRLVSNPTVSDEPLIDVYNRELEGPVAGGERIVKLSRLGGLYRAEANLEEAAVEVYREALALDPTHGPALRALAQIYERNGHWRGLAELYESELDQAGPSHPRCRRHYELAELYHRRLDQPQEALFHYQEVLDRWPDYRPAIDACVALMERLERWEDLADLCLAKVEGATSQRRKLSLLERAADIAETRLNHPAVAIGAWREVLRLEPGYPRAWSALKRLYADTNRWESLVDLRLAEVEFMDAPGDLAATFHACAQLVEGHLGDLDRAKSLHEQALDVLPDFSPSIGDLSRLYQREGRWQEVAGLVERELQVLDEPHVAVERWENLAELYEGCLDEEEKALDIYRRVLGARPGRRHALEAALRLSYKLQRWSSVRELLGAKLARCDDAPTRARVHGEMASLHEVHFDDHVQACRHYVDAMCADPENLHWLSGIERTWARAGREATELAGILQDRVVEPVSAAARDAYFKVIGRLFERAERTPEASRAFRAHGDQRDVENRLVLEMAMAVADERRVLRDFRRLHPEHAIERVIDINRVEASRGDLNALAAAAAAITPAEREALLLGAQGDLCAQFADGGALDWTRFRADLHKVLGGAGLDDAQGGLPEAYRLRALRAKAAVDMADFEGWTRRELDSCDSGHLRAARLVELASFAEQHETARLDALLAQAADAVFPELDGRAAPSADAPSTAALYELLSACSAWTIQRRCLEAHVAREHLDEDSRLDLYRQLGELLEVELADLGAACEAVAECWALSEDPDYLRELVRLHIARDDHATATRFQRRHLEHLSEDPTSAVSTVVDSGLALAGLLLADPDRVAEGIDCLEGLLERYAPDGAQGREVRQRLAYAYDGTGRPDHAAEVFEAFLGDEVHRDDVEHWRRLAAIYRDELGRLDDAYRAQWALVAFDPGAKVDLDALVDIAAFHGSAAECVADLRDRAAQTQGETRSALIARAADLTMEELFRVDEAEALYAEALAAAPTGDNALELRRRRAFCLAQIIGREAEALETFRGLIRDEPFEPTTYRGLRDLLNRAQAHDRARVAAQVLRTLDCEVKLESYRGKRNPSRPLGREHIEAVLLPEGFGEGVLDVLRAAMPLVEKVFADELPQRKALEGMRLKKMDDDRIREAMEGSMLGMDVIRYKAECGDTGPDMPQVFAGSTPYIWLNWETVRDLDPAGLRFVTGWAAAVAWTGVGGLEQLDGRRVWHLIEAVYLKQTGRGFTERVDVQTQALVKEIASPFMAVARRRLVAVLEPVVDAFADASCETWAASLRTFACRVGLTVSGDVTAAVEGLLRFEGWGLPVDMPETQRQLRRRPETRDLLAFALSEGYLQTRYHLGLAGRPSQLPD